MQDIRKNSLFKASYFAAFYLCIAVQDLFLLIDIQKQKLAPIVAKTFIYKQIMDGERITLTLWFSRDASHDEDAKLISLLSDQSLHSSKTDFASCLPVAASNKMYWFPPEEASDFQSGYDIRCARLHVLGLDLYFSDEESSLSALDSSHYLAELLKESLQLARGDELLVWKFVNILHAVQVVQFCHWNASELKSTELKVSSTDVIPLSKSQQLKINCQNVVLLKDPQLAKTFFGGVTGGNNMQRSFDLDWFSFSAGVSKWDAYICKLQKEMLMSLPCWRRHQSIFQLDNFNQGV
ncbi:Hypothetical predicted protein [Olea europaea subsp. europaea]|uniref:Uncharacterized protein n=1 Tax=Olea europaea subsp. europaea TaxID=158383 RepID=A0A8S0TZF3_OLEEU|nr:Hypothetical predicted protein [Olea europaea subsp. europaea]